MNTHKLILLVPIISIICMVNKKNKVDTILNKTQFPRTNPVIAEYDVKLTHTGYIALYGKVQDCQIRSNGTVTLSGILKGNEAVAADDDIIYNGTLHITINMDICSAKRLANGEDKLCGMTVTGSGSVRTELTIYSDGQDSARGAYIQFEYDSTIHGRFTRSVVGNCDHREMVEEENMVPNETIASIFNGRDLPMLTDRRLRIGRFVERDGPHETVVEVLRKIR